MASQFPRDADAGPHPDHVVTLFGSPWTAAALLVAALIQQSMGHLDGDVSWFTTFAEKYVDGATPYVDITDPNPPASFLALAPAVLVARALHLAVEPVLAALVFVFAFLSLVLSAAILRFGAQRSREDWGRLLNASIFLLLVVPEFVFAEREHLALLALMPFLATLAVVGAGGRAPVGLRIAAGVGAGLAVSFKPFFALSLALPALALALRERSPRLLLTPEMAMACVVALAYGLMIVILFPAYANYALPIIVEIYQPARINGYLLAFLTLAPFNVILLVSLAFAARGGLTPARPRPDFVVPASMLVCGFASLGFLAGFFIQGKGWMNHAYPGIALALFAWIFFLLDVQPHACAAREGRLFKFVFLPIFIASPMLFGANKLLMDEEEHPGLRAEIVRIAPPHPRVMALAHDLDYGHPVTRHLEGTWVGRPNALWVAAFAKHLLQGENDPARRARLEDHRAKDLADFAQDVRVGQPDVIIIADKTSREFGLAQPAIAEAFADYEKTGAAGEIEIWTRKAR